MYAATRAIERQNTVEVLTGVPILVRSVIRAEKFSFFLLNGAVLELAAKQGWTPEDNFQREFTARSPIFAAVVTEQQFLAANHPSHELILAEEGLLAGPLFSEEAGEVFGMLKIEALPFHEFTPSTLQNFHTVCEWIGSAFAKAQRLERLLRTHKPPARTRFK